MVAFVTAAVLVLVIGALLAIPVVARSRPHSRLAQAIRGAGERYNELYLAGHTADDAAPEWAVPTGPAGEDDGEDPVERDDPADGR